MGATVLTLLAAMAGAEPPSAVSEPLLVEHTAGRAVYLAGGQRQGLSSGDQLEVAREDRIVALIEVVQVTEFGAACRILHQFVPVEVGDQVLPVPAETITVLDTLEPETPAAPGRRARRPRRPREPFVPVLTTEVSGTAFLVRQTREAGSDRTRRTDESTARITLRARDIGGRPLDFSARLRAREQSRNFGSGPASASDQRFYDLSLTWRPEEGRSWVQAGRIGSRNEVGSGFLDGVAGQWGLSRRFGLGGFAGTNPDADETPFESAQTKGGLFFTYASNPSERGRYGEVLLAAIGEYAPGGALSREYLYLQSRVGNSARWSLYEQAEVDLNRGWRRELTGDSYQLSNLSLSLSFRASDRVRTTLSYDSRRRYRDWETRELPEEAFDELLRDGLRASVFFRARGGLNTSIAIGQTGGEGSAESVTSLSTTLSHSHFLDRRIFASAELTAYRGDSSDGFLASARARKYLRGGHDLGLAVGVSRSTSAFAVEPASRQWVRLEGTVGLPRGLFLLAELELGFGGEQELREMVQLGYRF